jgi:hypothetical protein
MEVYLNVSIGLPPGCEKQFCPTEQCQQNCILSETDVDKYLKLARVHFPEFVWDKLPEAKDSPFKKWVVFGQSKLAVDLKG